jgi:hypothetical protein
VRWESLLPLKETQSSQLAGESLKPAQARSNPARAAPLPDVEGALRYESLTSYLGAYRIKVNIPISGFAFPSLVGPFNVMDARLSGTQTVFDFSSIRRFKASRTGVSTARSRAHPRLVQRRSL